MQLSSPTQPSQRFRFVLFTAIAMTAVAGGALLRTSPNPVLALPLTLAIASLLCVLCVLTRIFQLDAFERPAWYWIAFAAFVWAIGQLLVAANHRIADGLCIAASLPLLLAVSAAPAARQARSLGVFNLVQAILAAGLISLEAGNRTMEEAALAVVATAVFLRWVAASTREDQHRTGLLAVFLLIYGPITAFLHPQPASFFNIVRLLPLLLFGLLVLLTPVVRPEERQETTPPRIKLFMQGLSPAVFPCFVFVLAVLAMRQHFAAAAIAMLASLAVQGASFATVQTNMYVAREEFRHQQERLKSANASLEQLTSIDFLTNLPNRRTLTEALETEHRRAIRQQEWISILMIDIDHFQAVNQVHGQAYGDMCLIKMAEALSAEMRRAADMAARYGGGEFAVLLPGTDLRGAYIVAENLQRAVAQLSIHNDASPFQQRLTISIGVASVHPGPGQSMSVLLEAADKALRAAKQQGRNRNSLQEVTVTSAPASIHPGYLQ